MYIIVNKIWPEKILETLEIEPNEKDWELMRVVEDKIKGFLPNLNLDKGEIGEIICYSCMTSSKADVEFVESHELCSMCGWCCQNCDPIIVKPSEVPNFGRFNGVELDERGKNFIIKTPCVHLRDNMCTIYDKRPESCRNFPFKTQNGKIVVQKTPNCDLILKLLVAKTLRLLVECQRVK